MAITETLRVEGMSCGGCEDNIRRALTTIDGVEAVEADHTTDTVRVTFEPSAVEVATLRERIDEIGYTVGG
jgi:copper chaperone